MTRSKWLAVCGVALVVWFAGLVTARSAPPAYEVYAVRFAHVPYPESSLVAGGDRATLVDIAFTVWVARGPDRIALIDAGFYRDKFTRAWKPQDYVRPPEALKLALGIEPDQVTEVVVTHVHWDHVDGVDLFPRARVFIQREEYEHYVGPNGQALDRAIDPEDAQMLAGLHAAGRVVLVDGDAREILPGITVYTGGKHTFASQYAGVETRAGVVVIASDNAYLYKNLEARLPIAQTLDARANVSALARMLAIASAPRFVVPGHDPAVFERFPTPKRGVAKIE